MPLKTSSKEVMCNTKIKEYRDGSYTITRSDRHIFKDPAFEYHCKHEHSIDERSRQEQLKKAREDFGFEEFAGNEKQFKKENPVEHAIMVKASESDDNELVG